VEKRGRKKAWGVANPSRGGKGKSSFLVPPGVRKSKKRKKKKRRRGKRKKRETR